MNFKEQLDKDLNVFINIDEFAEQHELDGKLLPVVVDGDDFKEFSGILEMENAMRGIFQTTLTVYVKSSDFEKPDVGSRLTLDDKSYFVTSVSESAGVLKIVLSAYES